MKSSIVITLIITGGILILAPIVTAYHQSDKIAEVLPYLVAETELSDPTNSQTDSIAYHTKRIGYLEKATLPLETAAYPLYDWCCAILGSVMIFMGSRLAYKSH
jgi:hypothetical protein